MTIEALGSYRFEGMNVGEHALAGTLRFYARGTLGDDSYQTEIARRYFEASLLTSYAMRRLLSNYSFNASCCNHGIYVPHGLVGEAARSAGVRVVNWNAGYRKQRFIFSHGDTYHHTMLSEPTRNWDTMPWTSETETATIEYLKSRWQGTNDWIWFHDRPDEALDSIATQTGVDFEKPCIGLLTNVIWDAQLHYRANAFPNMLVWLIETIKYFARRPNLQLLIRVHPAEIRGFIPSRQHAVDEIRKVFPTLPPNVFVVPPESQVSTYAAMERCDAVIIYGTKTGVELTSLGIPVIVAGEAWIRDKGITMDARSTEEYFAWLDRLPLQKRLPKEVVTRAHKYAYHFFFRRMIPLPFMRVLQGWPPYELALESLSQLQPGKSKGLDVICDGILQGKEFIYPEETLTGHSVPDSLSTRV
jgi:hypothetical protein